MTSNEITQIAEIIQSLGDSTKEGLIWYLAIDYGKSFLWATVVGYMILNIYRIARQMTQVDKDNEAYKLYIEEMFNASGYPGYIDMSSRSSRNAVVKYIKTLRKDSND